MSAPISGASFRARDTVGTASPLIREIVFSVGFSASANEAGAVAEVGFALVMSCSTLSAVPSDQEISPDF